ncbi:MAG: hypothetical protein QME49_04635 [bacterium]|nr:hypothetical protein [bacterium]
MLRMIGSFIFKVFPLFLVVYFLPPALTNAKIIYKAMEQRVAVLYAQHEMNLIANAVITNYQLTGKFPANLDEFIRAHLRANDKDRDITLDRWGKKYIFEVNHNYFKIKSSGPDKKCGTGDDVVVSGACS